MLVLASCATYDRQAACATRESCHGCRCASTALSHGCMLRPAPDAGHAQSCTLPSRQIWNDLARLPGAGEGATLLQTSAGMCRPREEWEPLLVPTKQDDVGQHPALDLQEVNRYPGLGQA